MKFDISTGPGSVPRTFVPLDISCYVTGETDRLTDVILCPPHHLQAVPCCAVTRESLCKGFTVNSNEALAQHEALVDLLWKHGVRSHMLDPSPELPDMCFTRDIGVATPWGLVALRPAMPHRRGETEALLQACARWSLRASKIEQGTIEGGDVCVARDGLLLIGLSGERSCTKGVDAFTAPFRQAGWEVLVCHFHADHLHLDTIFCMLDRTEAIACVELLDPEFVHQVTDRGIQILPVPARSATTLGCNILSLGERRIVASAGDRRVIDTLENAGYAVETVEISQFAKCGGGIHCLTQPIRRVPL